MENKTSNTSNFSTLKTEELCDLIVTKVHVKIPYYDYQVLRYITDLPDNDMSGGGASGVYDTESTSNFRNACMRIIYWHIDNFPNEPLI